MAKADIKVETTTPATQIHRASGEMVLDRWGGLGIIAQVAFDQWAVINLSNGNRHSYPVDGIINLDLTNFRPVKSCTITAEV